MTRRVLIVDDTMESRYMLTALLSHCDCLVSAAESGQEALELAWGLKPQTVFLDIKMPEMDGYELARRLRSESGLNHAKIVAISGLDCDVTSLRAAGIDSYLRKPVMLHSLQRALESQ